MKISNHIHFIRIPFKVQLSEGVFIDRFVNCFIIVGKHITLVDTGVVGSEKVIFDYIESIGRKPSEIKLVLLTHTHPDHIGAVKAIKEATKCKVAVHEAEKNWVEDIDNQFNERPVPGFYGLVGGSCKTDIILTDNQEIELDSELSVRVIHCPGHSAGSVAFQLTPDNALFTGDIIPVKGDIPIYDNWMTNLKSIEKIENLHFPDYLLSAWSDIREGSEVDTAISEGFEVLYAVHQAYTEVVAEKPNNDFETVTKLVLEKLGMPFKIINPLFARGLKSHA